MDNALALQDYLSKPRKVVITTHHKPDADALGSSLGLANYLKKKGHSVQVITPSDYPIFLSWMPGNEAVLSYDKSKEPQVAAYVQSADIIFCLDFSAIGRIYDMADMVRFSTAKKVMVDHHLEPESFAEFVQWDPAAASTAQLIYKMILELGDREVIDENIASCLYAGLMTDTGGFRHNNTHQNEFLIAAELVAMGANPSRISKLVYETNTLTRLRLMGYILSEKLVVLDEFRVAYITITEEELKRFGSQTGDTEGLVNYGLSVQGVKMAALIYKRKEDVKLSFRSLGNFSVSDFSRLHFEGGGHKNASGGQTKLSLEETLQKFLGLLPYYKEQLNSID